MRTTTLTIGNEDLSLTLFDQVKELRSMKDHPYMAYTGPGEPGAFLQL